MFFIIKSQKGLFGVNEVPFISFNINALGEAIVFENSPTLKFLPPRVYS